jgi:LacI family transcriptional regulator
MNGSEAVSEAVRDRVLEAARTLLYVPNLPARRLSSGRTNAIAFVAAELNSMYAARVVNGFVAAADGVGYRGMLFNTQRDAERRDLSIVASLVHGREVDGLILFRSRADAPELEEAARRVPIVLIDPHRCEPETVPHVVVDNAGGTRLAVEHLIGLGHRRIGHLTYENGLSLWMNHRIDAYRATLREYGLPDDDSLLMVAPSRDTCGEGAVALMARPNPPTAIFAVSDWSGASAVNALERAGLRVPDHVSVVSFDDGPLAEHSRPSITSVHQPMAQLAHTAIAQLIEMVNGRTPVLRSVLPTRLVVRESSGPPRDAAGHVADATLVAAAPPVTASPDAMSLNPLSRNATSRDATQPEAIPAGVGPTSRTASA